ncbi:oxidoreductase [Rhodococcus sp. 05-2254-6]|nr:oxidoreductase [Rhodococcus sp. 05-2254-6]OZE88422.1 oxidoreductase [Rhodococcus sp. 15-649-2-2]OZE99252.1 oxidoreductase [Rhodococcus sp. 15-2388-1-1a]
MRYPLKDKVVFLTGSGQGVGAATARELNRRGARVAVVDIDLVNARRVAGELPAGRAIAINADVTNPISVQEAVAETTSMLGPIDVAIANAGVLGRPGRLQSLASADFEKVMSVNVVGAVNTAAATLDSIIARRGQIVVVSSVFAVINGAAALPYAMSKAAVEKLGQGLAVELAAQGASAMTVYFSLVDTPMIRDGVDASPEVTRLLEESSPAPLLVRISPEAAAKAVVDGLQRRAHTVIAPKRWRAVFAARGVVGPITDRKLMKNSRIGELLSGIDAARRTGSEV